MSMNSSNMKEQVSGFSTKDLQRMAYRCEVEPGVYRREQLVEAIINQCTTSQLQKLIAFAFDHINEPVDEYVARRYSEPSLSQEDADAQEESKLNAKVIEELKNWMEERIKSTQEGIVSFAKGLDDQVQGIQKTVHRIESREPLVIQVNRQAANDQEKFNEKIQTESLPKQVVHRQFPNLLQFSKAGVNILLVGPAGSGKTTAAEHVAKALGRNFYFNGAIDTEYKLKGFIDAQGRVIHTAFREAFEKGGVYLFDELDASLPGATLAFNAALANGWCDFPDGRVVRHPETVIIAAANTYLGGATFEYVGRNKQDAAFVDRFTVLEWPVDENLETALCSNQAWAKHVQAMRASAVKHGLKVIISPRASFDGAKLLNVGLPWDLVEVSTIKKGMSNEQWDTIRGQNQAAASKPRKTA